MKKYQCTFCGRTYSKDYCHGRCPACNKYALIKIAPDIYYQNNSKKVLGSIIKVLLITFIIFSIFQGYRRSSTTLPANQNANLDFGYSEFSTCEVTIESFAFHQESDNLGQNTWCYEIYLSANRAGTSFQYLHFFDRNQKHLGSQVLCLRFQQDGPHIVLDKIDTFFLSEICYVGISDSQDPSISDIFWGNIT